LDEPSTFENSFLSYNKASKARKSSPDIATFEISLEENLIKLQDDLLSGTYEHGKYHSVDTVDKVMCNVGWTLCLPPLGVESGMSEPGKQCRVEPHGDTFIRSNGTLSVLAIITSHIVLNPC